MPRAIELSLVVVALSYHCVRIGGEVDIGLQNGTKGCFSRIDTSREVCQVLCRGNLYDFLLLVFRVFINHLVEPLNAVLDVLLHPSDLDFIRASGTRVDLY